MIKIAYFGYSKEMLDKLLDDSRFDLKVVVAKPGRTSEEYVEIAKKHSKYIEILSKSQLFEIEDMLDEIDAILMYKFEFIIPKVIVNKYRIINFHGGNLRTNRGPHAVGWSVLNRDKETCLSCYELTGGIDEGLLIKQYDVKIDRDDSILDLNNKLAEGIPILLDKLYEYLTMNSRVTLINGGTYKRKIVPDDYTLDIECDPIDSIRGKVLSQVQYDGAILLENKCVHRIKRYENILVVEPCKKRIIDRTDSCITIYDEQDGIKLFVE